jgi:hypothetical protein
MAPQFDRDEFVKSLSSVEKDTSLSCVLFVKASESPDRIRASVSGNVWFDIDFDCIESAELITGGPSGSPRARVTFKATVPAAMMNMVRAYANESGLIRSSPQASLAMASPRDWFGWERNITSFDRDYFGWERG